MLESILSFFTWFYKLWTNIPEETRDDIIEKIVAQFEEIFRKYYRSEKNGGEF